MRHATNDVTRCVVVGAMVLAASLAAPAGAARVTWDGGGDGVSWHDPDNWDGDALPEPFDDVVIDVGSTITVDLGIAAPINSLQCQEQVRIVFGGALDIDSASSTVSLRLEGGLVQGFGNLTVEASFFWTGGGISGPGRTTLLAGSGSSIDIATPATLARSLDNLGLLQ